MKRNFYLIPFLCLAFSLFTYHTTYAEEIKWVKEGKIMTKIFDTCKLRDNIVQYYYRNFAGWGGAICGQHWSMGVRDWTDENGTFWPFKVCGVTETVDEITNTIPVVDDEGITIRRYKRYQPPKITVDSFRLDEPFPLDIADEVNPDKIPGTADVMVESWINTAMGVTIRQRVFAWTQTHHDDYMIFEWTFTNTGNVDLDDEIELPDQTLNDFYFYRSWVFCGGERPWASCYGEYPTDTMRISYLYPSRLKGSTYDNIANPDIGTGYLRSPQYIAEATLHVDKSADDHSDDPSQPQATGANVNQWTFNAMNSSYLDEEGLANRYLFMQLGGKPFDGTPYMVGVIDTTSQGDSTHHGLRMDERGWEWRDEGEWVGWWWENYLSNGPFTLGPKDSIRIVWCPVFGSITDETGWKVGKAWLNGECHILYPWEGRNNFPPPLLLHPEHSPTENDKAKDHWVHTGKDSLFMNVWAAQWATRNNYNVPIPPPPPSITVTSMPNRIKIEWGNESEVATDFAGYRLYRATGSPYYSEEGGVVVGKWEPIFECEGTATHSWDDEDVDRGVAYYYYVAAFDDGSENNGLYPGESLESGRYLNMTTRAAYLTRPPGEKLDDIRIVPNPFNISATELQYPGEPDKIMFLNLPPICTIKIYTESGDLIKTLEHTDGSGDEAWKNPTGEYFSTTTTGQIVVSGLYIAYIVTPTGESTTVKFFIVR